MDRLSRGALTSKNGFSVVAPINVSTPDSTAGSKASCWLLLKRCTSSRNRMVPRSASANRRRAPSMTSRTSFTPAVTADSDTNSRSVIDATTVARVVLPVPGGPHRTIEDRRSDSIRARSGAPGPSRCRCPTISSRRRGRIRAANGAFCASRSRRAASNKSSGGPAPRGPERGGTATRLRLAGSRRRPAAGLGSPPSGGARGWGPGGAPKAQHSSLPGCSTPETGSLSPAPVASSARPSPGPAPAWLPRGGDGRAGR